MVALIYAQLSGYESLLAEVTGLSANPQHHYHLATGKLSRSTLSDANARRPVSGGTFAMLSAWRTGSSDAKGQDSALNRRKPRPAQ